MKVGLDQIRIIPRRLRPLRAQVVVALKEDIGHHGLLVPIIVVNNVMPRPGGGMLLPAFDLAAGLHRLEACRALGWTEIEATCAGMITEGERRLIEIDDNLRRHELPELERGELLVARRDLYRRLKRKHFYGPTATAIGLTRPVIERALSRASRIDPKVRNRIRGKAIASIGRDLDALARLPPEEQMAAAVAALDGTHRIDRRISTKKSTGPRSSTERRRWRAAFLRRQSELLDMVLKDPLLPVDLQWWALAQMELAQQAAQQGVAEPKKGRVA